MKRIVVDPPVSETRQARVERKLFQQLAAVRVVERAEAVIPPAHSRRAGWFAAGAGLLAAAGVAVVLATGGEPSVAPASPSRIVTPVGGTSQVTLPGALIEAQSDTSVEVQHGADGSITLVVSRGAVECDVEPRPGRPPFRVIAGDVAVEVIGTRFTVARTPTSRVDVARGKVRVIAPGGVWLVEAGEAWPNVTRSAAAIPPVDEQPAAKTPPIATATAKPLHRATSPKKPASAAPAMVPPTQERERARESYKIANKLATTDPRKAAQLYRAIATDGKGMEAVALVSLAEVQLKVGDGEAALAALDELHRRFPGAANAEDAAWFRYEALRALGKRDEARGAAADYLRQFPNGAYAARLQQTR